MNRRNDPGSDLVVAAVFIGGAFAGRFAAVETDMSSGLTVVLAVAGLVGAALIALFGDEYPSFALGGIGAAATLAAGLAVGENTPLLAAGGVAVAAVAVGALVRPRSSGFLYAAPAGVLLAAAAPMDGAVAGLLLGALGALEILATPADPASAGAGRAVTAAPAAPPAPVPAPPATRATPDPAPLAPPASATVDMEDGSDNGDAEILVLGQPARAAGAVSPLPAAKGKFVAANVSERHALGHLEIAAASRRGYSHAHDDEPRQDDYAIDRTADGSHLVVAVADGLGSAEFSHLGANWSVRLACRITCAALSAQPVSALDGRGLAREIAAALPAAVAGDVGPAGRLSDDEISSTLVVAVVPTSSDEIWGFRVGDSDLLIRNGDRWQSMFGVDADGGATSALPQNPDAAETTYYEFPPGSVAMLATDGVSRVIDASPDIVGTAFSQQLTTPVSETTFSRLVGFSRRGAHDDRTAVAIWNTGRTSSG